MTHTVESLMSLATQYHEATINWVASGEPTSKARAALHTALTEVLAERDTLQSKCDELAREIEALRKLIGKEANDSLENQQLRAKVAAMESQEPVAYTVAGEVTNWARDFSKYKTQHYTRPVILAPGAAQKENKDAV